MLLHKPRCLIVLIKWVGHKFNFARLIKIQDSIAFFYFSTGLISERHGLLLLKSHATENLAHVQAAVDVEDLASDVAGLVAGEEDDGGGNVAVGAEASERDHRFHFVF